MKPAVMTCSQWGAHPHEMYPPHETTGIGKLRLEQYDPPKIVTFSLCRRCAWEIHEYWRDKRFWWVQKPKEKQDFIKWKRPRRRS